jgi:tetratricopeptide (TPR) repeat protein
VRQAVEGLLPEEHDNSEIALVIPPEASETERYAAALARFHMVERGASTRSTSPLDNPVPESGLPERLGEKTLWKLKREDASLALFLRISTETDSHRLMAGLYGTPDFTRMAETEEVFHLPQDLEFMRSAKPRPLPQCDQRWLRVLRGLFPACEPPDGLEDRKAFALGRHLFRRHLWKAAARRLAAAAEARPESCLLHYAVALQLADEGKVALEKVEKAIQMKPDSGPLYALKAWLLLRAGAPDDAVLFLEQARLSDVSREGCYHLARHLMAVERGNKKNAMQALKKAVELLPRRPYVHLVAARFYWGEAQLDRATEAFRKAIEAGAEREEGANVWGEFGMALDASGKTEEAIEAFRRGFELEPGNASLARHLASLLRSTGRYDSALEVLARAARVRPQRSELFVAWGDAAAQMWRTKQAQAAYELALKAGKGTQGRLGLARMLTRRGRLQEARQALERLLERAPHDGEARLALGEVLARQGQMKRAVEVIQQAAQDSNSEAPARIALAHLHRRAGNHQQAVHEAQIAVAAQISAAAYAALARAFIASGEYPKAETALQKGLESAGPSADLQMAAARLHAAREKPEQALKAAREALDIDPHQPPALIFAGRMQKQLGRLQECAELWTRAAELDRWNAPLEWDLAKLLHRELNQPGEATAHYARHAELGGQHAEKAQELARELSPNDK